MARANTIQTNFTSGEISPIMLGRVDVTKYFNGAKKLRNMLVRPQGGIIRRSGTRYVNEVKTSSKVTRVVRFVFSNVQAYVLEFGDLYVRIYRNGGIVENPPGTPVEVTTPYLEADLMDLQFTQSADVLYITHGSYQTRTLSRTSHTSWSLSTYAPVDGPYLDIDTSGKLITLELVSDVTTLISNLQGSTVAFASTSIFAGGDVNKYLEYVRITDAASVEHKSLVKITAFTSGTQVSVENHDADVIDSTYDIVTFGSGQVTCIGTTKFTSASVGKFIRLTASMAWYQITSIVTTAIANATAVTIVSYGGGTTIRLQSGFQSGDVNKFVEYSKDGRWHLAKILTFVSFTKVTVDVIDQLLLYDEALDVNFSTGTSNIDITSSASGVFKPGDIGKYIRAAESQKWALIDNYVSSSKVNGDVVSSFSYSFPETRMNLREDRVITARATCTESLFVSTDVGRPLRVRYGSQWRCLTITTVISPTQVTGTMDDFIPYDNNNAQDLYNGGQADDFRLGAWSVATGWPSVATFHDQRVAFFRTSTQPQTMWMTKTGAFTEMSPTEPDGVVLDDGAITITVVSGRSDPVTWAITGPVLLVGTIGSEFQVKPSSISKGLAPTNIAAIPQTAFGSVDLDTPIRVGSAVLFIQSGGNKIREMLYDFNIDAYTGRDITIISEHILRERSGANVMAYQGQPTSTVWIVCNNGTLVAITYERDQEVVAFHVHELGGSGVVESITSIPGTTNDDVYMVVRRTINGSTKRYIERFERDFDSGVGDTVADAFFVDCGLSYSGAPATTISGLSHLNGATVQVLADGVYVGNKVVSGGQITLAKAASKVHVGFAYQSQVTTVDYEGGSQAGTSQGKTKRISDVTVRVKDTATFNQGPSETELDRINDMQFDGASLFTGDLDFGLDGRYDGASLVLQQSQPLPMHILSIMPALNTND